VAETLERVIQRADELAEFVALYMKDGRQPLSAQVKRGLAAAFRKFDQHALAKYDRKDAAVRLRDVLFLVHAKPDSVPGITSVRYADAIKKHNYKRGMTLRHVEGRGATWKQLIDGTLPIPDTWETALSAGEDKRKTWERLLKEHTLGALATIRNLRNMREAKVSLSAIRAHIAVMPVDRVLPFRFIAAARYAPELEPELEQAMFRCVAGLPKLPGKTALLVDCSGSMEAPLSEKSEVTRFDAAKGLAILARELCEDVDVVAFSAPSNEKRGVSGFCGINGATIGWVIDPAKPGVALVPSRRGFALSDAITTATARGGTNTEDGKLFCDARGYDRLIIITDEQSHQALSNPKGKGYVINVASAKNGVGYGAWMHLDGFSEAVLDYIREIEKTEEAHPGL